MKRKIALALVVLVVGAIVFMGYRVWRGAAAKRATAERVQTLPAFEAAALDGRALSEGDFAGGQPLVLVYFSTTCHFCQNETESIKAHDALTASAPVVMVSSEGRAALRQFEKEYGLAQAPGVRVLRDASGEMAETFGVRTVPSTFVYAADGRLLKHFQGEASAEALYAALQGEPAVDASTPDSAVVPAGCTASAALDDCSSDEN